MPENIIKAGWKNDNDFIIKAEGHPLPEETHPDRKHVQGRNNALSEAQAYMVNFFTENGMLETILSTSVDKEKLDKLTGCCIIYYNVHTTGRKKR